MELKNIHMNEIFFKERNGTRCDWKMKNHGLNGFISKVKKFEDWEKTDFGRKIWVFLQEDFFSSCGFVTIAETIGRKHLPESLVVHMCMTCPTLLPVILFFKTL